MLLVFGFFLIYQNETIITQGRSDRVYVTTISIDETISYRGHRQGIVFNNSYRRQY